MKIIRGRKALITGAGAGIGRAIALELARHGSDLWLLDIDAAGLETTAAAARDSGVTVMTSVCDLTDRGQVSAAVAAVVSTWGALHILVNNAGVMHYGATHEMSAAQVDAILALNLMAPIQLTRELLPTLLAQDESHVLNVCSVAAYAPFRRAAVYQTSKAGLYGFSMALRVEHHRPQFGVTALCPGIVDTAMLQAPTVRGHRAPGWVRSRPETVAARAVRAIRRNRSVVVVSPLARIYWWLMRLAPGFMVWTARAGWRRAPRKAG